MNRLIYYLLDVGSVRDEFLKRRFRSGEEIHPRISYYYLKDTYSVSGHWASRVVTPWCRCDVDH